MNYQTNLSYETVSANLILKKSCEISNTKLFEAFQQLTALCKPSFQDEFDIIWESFYIPLIKNNKFVTIPVKIKYFDPDKYYSMIMPTSYYPLIVDEGNSEVKNSEIFTILKEIENFLPEIKKSNYEIIEKTVSKEFRTGKIKLKYLNRYEDYISEEEAGKILDDYNKHSEKNLGVESISLNDYISVTSLCVRTAFTEYLTDEMTNLQVHKSRADQRHGGMFDLEDFDSKEEFSNWVESEKWRGAHPFEFVYGTPHGLVLYPPTRSNRFHAGKPDCYMISCSDSAYYPEYVEMIKVLIEKEVPFQAYGLKSALDRVTGNEDAFVNYSGGYSMTHQFIDYKENEPESAELLDYIDWDPIKKIDIK